MAVADYNLPNKSYAKLNRAQKYSILPSKLSKQVKDPDYCHSFPAIYDGQGGFEIETKVGKRYLGRSKVQPGFAKQLTPPPPPPPPLPYPNSVRINRESYDGSNLRGYVSNIATSAKKHREKTLESSKKVLQNRIEHLNNLLGVHKENELALQTMNARLRDRILKYKEQEQFDKDSTSKKIEELEKLVEIKNMALSLAVIEKGKREDYLKTTLLQLKNRTSKRDIPGLREFQEKVMNRRAKTMKSKVLEAWACQHLINKICEEALLNRRLERRRRLFHGWKYYLEYKRIEKRRKSWADDYFVRRILLKRIMSHWKKQLKRRKKQSKLQALLTWRVQAKSIRMRRCSWAFHRWLRVVTKNTQRRLEQFKDFYILSQPAIRDQFVNTE